MLTRKLKDNGSVNTSVNMEHPWQEKVYAKKPIKKFVDYFIPKTGTKEYRKMKDTMKEIMPLEKTINQVKQIENLHLLIKNKGKNFDLSKEEIELSKELI